MLNSNILHHIWLALYNNLCFIPLTIMIAQYRNWLMRWKVMSLWIDVLDTDTDSDSTTQFKSIISIDKNWKNIEYSYCPSSIFMFLQRLCGDIFIIAQKRHVKNIIRNISEKISNMQIFVPLKCWYHMQESKGTLCQMSIWVVRTVKGCFSGMIIQMLLIGV